MSEQQARLLIQQDDEKSGSRLTCHHYAGYFMSMLLSIGITLLIVFITFDRIHTSTIDNMKQQINQLQTNQMDLLSRLHVINTTVIANDMITQQRVDNITHSIEVMNYELSIRPTTDNMTLTLTSMNVSMFQEQRQSAIHVGAAAQCSTLFPNHQTRAVSTTSSDPIRTCHSYCGNLRCLGAVYQAIISNNSYSQQQPPSGEWYDKNMTLGSSDTWLTESVTYNHSVCDQPAGYGEQEQIRDISQVTYTGHSIIPLSPGPSGATTSDLLVHLTFPDNFRHLLSIEYFFSTRINTTDPSGHVTFGGTLLGLDREEGNIPFAADIFGQPLTWNSTEYYTNTYVIPESVFSGVFFSRIKFFSVTGGSTTLYDSTAEITLTYNTVARAPDPHHRRPALQQTHTYQGYYCCCDANKERYPN